MSGWWVARPGIVAAAAFVQACASAGVGQRVGAIFGALIMVAFGIETWKRLRRYRGF